MKRILLVSLGVLVFGMASASANSEGYRFDCRFMGVSGKTFDRCELKARACEFIRETQDVMNHGECRDAMYLECNGQLLFRGFATHLVHEGHQILRGEPTGQSEFAPVLKYESNPLTGQHSTITAWLLADGAVLNGFCSVHAPTLD